MKKPKQHQIDTRAKKTFEDLIPDAWNVNEHFNDYGKDYHVELGDSGILTGEGCFIQLNYYRLKPVGWRRS
jgi:hypothetical protein